MVLLNLIYNRFHITKKLNSFCLGNELKIHEIKLPKEHRKNSKMLRQNHYHKTKCGGEEGGRTSAAVMGTGLVAVLEIGLLLLIAAAFGFFERASTKSESVLLLVSWEAFLEGTFRTVHLRLVDDCAPSASSGGSSIKSKVSNTNLRVRCIVFLY